MGRVIWGVIIGAIIFRIGYWFNKNVDYNSNPRGLNKEHRGGVRIDVTPDPIIPPEEEIEMLGKIVNTKYRS
jgi:hypothetical protein